MGDCFEVVDKGKGRKIIDNGDEHIFDVEIKRVKSGEPKGLFQLILSMMNDDNMIVSDQEVLKPRNELFSLEVGELTHFRFVFPLQDVSSATQFKLCSNNIKRERQ